MLVKPWLEATDFDFDHAEQKLKMGDMMAIDPSLTQLSPVLFSYRLEKSGVGFRKLILSISMGS